MLLFIIANASGVNIKRQAPAYVAKAYALVCWMSNIFSLAYAPAGCLLPVQSLPTLAGAWAKVYAHACTQVSCARPLLAKV